MDTSGITEKFRVPIEVENIKKVANTVQVYPKDAIIKL